MSPNNEQGCGSVCNLVVIQKGRPTTIPIGPCGMGVEHKIHLSHLKYNRYRHSPIFIIVQWADEASRGDFMVLPACKACGEACVSLVINEGAGAGQRAYGCKKPECPGFKDLLGAIQATKTHLEPPPPCPKCKKFMWWTVVSEDGEPAKIGWACSNDGKGDDGKGKKPPCPMFKPFRKE